MGRTVAICVLLSLAALAWADTSYQNFQTYQNSAPSYYESDSYPSSPTGVRRQSFAESVSGLFSPSIRRQFGLGGLFGFAPLIFGLLAAGFVVVIILVVVSTATNFSSSGRGLDTDTWEVDHSVWMNQLQKDFEDSWSAE